MNAGKNVVIRILERKEFPFFEIVMTAAIFSLAWMLYAGGVFQSDRRSLDAINHQRLVLLSMAVNTYKWTNNSFPSSLGALVCEGRDKRSCIPTTVPEFLTDVWGVPYDYQPAEKFFTIKCLGADKKEGGSGPDQDHVIRGP